MSRKSSVRGRRRQLTGVTSALNQRPPRGPIRGDFLSRRLPGERRIDPPDRRQIFAWLDLRASASRTECEAAILRHEYWFGDKCVEGVPIIRKAALKDKKVVLRVSRGGSMLNPAAVAADKSPRFALVV